MNPAPLPTPYDIAELPIFERPLLLTDLLLPLIVVLLCLAIMWFLRNRSKPRSLDRVKKGLCHDIDRALRSTRCSKSDFAVCWKKIARASERYHALKSVISNAQPKADELLFGPSYSVESAQILLKQAKDQLTEVQ